MTARRIGDRFVVGEPLGAGGMGNIYRGRDERLGQDIAIKIMKRAFADDPVARERFRREARSLAMLKHPGIVSVLDAGESGGDLYTVMELVSGETLEAVLGRDGAWSEVVAAPLFDELLSALEACHAGDVVHRDLKPSNVMVSATAPLHVKLIDFGLARLENGPNEKLTETGTVQGTASYMAPEQCRGEATGPPCDIYAAGVLFYEMLAGQPPFRGSDAATLMAQHLFVEPPRLRDVAPGVSEGVAAAVHAALAKEASDRPTASALRAALAAVTSGTDPQSLAASLAVARHGVAGLTRAERMLAAAPRAPASDGADLASVALTSAVTVWMSAGDRGAAIRSALGVAGLPCDLASGNDLPERGTSDDRAAAVIVSARDGLDRVTTLRARFPRASILVVDIATPDETTQAIRAGAADVLLRESPDSDLAAKLLRVLKRGRRR